MTVLKRMIPALAVTGALVLPVQAMAGMVESEIQDIDRTAGTMVLDDGQVYHVSSQVEGFGELDEGDRVNVWYQDESESGGPPVVTRISAADDETAAAVTGDRYAAMDNDTGSEDAWDERASAADATINEVDQTAGTVVMTDGETYRVQPQAANFDKLEEGDKVRFWATTEEGEGPEVITHIVRVQDDGTPMEEDALDLEEQQAQMPEDATDSQSDDEGNR